MNFLAIVVSSFIIYLAAIIFKSAITRKHELTVKQLDYLEEIRIRQEELNAQILLNKELLKQDEVTLFCIKKCTINLIEGHRSIDNLLQEHLELFEEDGQETDCIYDAMNINTILCHESEDFYQKNFKESYDDYKQNKIYMEGASLFSKN
jgi:hypothetical protein